MSSAPVPTERKEIRDSANSPVIFIREPYHMHLSTHTNKKTQQNFKYSILSVVLIKVFTQQLSKNSYHDRLIYQYMISLAISNMNTYIHIP